MWIVLNSVLGVDGGVVDPRGGSALLSCAHDRDSMDAIRAAADAVLVGAGTIRTENPSLGVRSPVRRTERRSTGRPEHPLPVILSTDGDLPADRVVFETGEPRPLLLVARRRADVDARLAAVAEVEVLDADAAAPVGVERALARRGLRRLLVEGGPSVARAFVTAGLVDEVCLTLSPRLGGRPAPPADADHHLTDLDLAESRAVHGFLYLRYLRRTPRHVD